MVGTGVGASMGMLIRGGDALERAHNVTAMVFDKTGTLTQGRPEVLSFLMLAEKNELGRNRLLSLAASAEHDSEHPLARAVLRYVERQGNSAALRRSSFVAESG